MSWRLRNIYRLLTLVVAFRKRRRRERKGHQKGQVFFAWPIVHSKLNNLQLLDGAWVVQQHYLLIEGARVDHGSSSLWISDALLEITFDQICANAPSCPPKQQTHIQNNNNSVAMMVTPIAVILLFLMVNGQTEDFLRFWPPDASFLQPVPAVSRALFVTSWNPVSRKVALQHASKFQSIILCLYDLHFDKERFRLQKLVKIESSFLQELRQANPEIRVFLRVFMVGSACSLFEYVGSSTKKIAEVASTIVRVMRREKVNGVYFDSSFNLPIVGTASGPYDKFAALLNGYIANKIKELLWESEQLMFGVQVGDEGVADVDFAALKQIKADALMVEALESPHALSHALKFVHQIRDTGDEHPMDYFIAVPLFSWRNGIGVRTTLVREALQKNGVAKRGFKNGLCAYVEQIGGAQSIVPCQHYFQVVRKYASEVGVKLAFFQAGDAIDAMFDMI